MRFRLGQEGGTNPNPNYNEIGLHTHEVGYDKQQHTHTQNKQNLEIVLTRMWRNGNACALLVGTYHGTTSGENHSLLLKKSNMELPYDPEIPALDIFPNELKAETGADIRTPVFGVPCSQQWLER